MQEMKIAFPDTRYTACPIIQQATACQTAIALRASVVERHFTDLMINHADPDICCPMDEQATSELMAEGKKDQSI